MTQYYSKTKKELVNINDMHHQHVWYAFKKLCDRLEQLALTQAIWDDAFNPAKDIKVNDYVRKDVYELLFDKCERQDRTIEHYLNENSKLKKNANSRMVSKLEQEVSRLRRELKRLTKTNKNMYHSYFNPNSYSEYLHNLKNKGHRYVFSNIPNTEEGRQTIHKLRKWLNKDTYNMRIRGQYLDKTKLSDGETWKNYNDGQPLSKSRCIRVYLDKKKESA
tara:strand:- start:614 stop:1273 length:660 start_codon:yes stop_codon:yes gene_type:complete